LRLILKNEPACGKLFTSRNEPEFREQNLNGCVIRGFLLNEARADGSRFTYSYEPETTPQGELEFEQWVTLRTQRTKGG